MGTHSVAEAKNKLPEIIDRALSGESVAITRHGKPVAELRPISAPPRPVTAADADWLSERMVTGTPSTDAGTLLSKMRDEDWM